MPEANGGRIARSFGGAPTGITSVCVAMTPTPHSSAEMFAVSVTAASVDGVTEIVYINVTDAPGARELGMGP